MIQIYIHLDKFNKVIISYISNRQNDKHTPSKGQKAEKAGIR